jgi:two-component system, LytTR family, sensor kinase
LPKASKLRKMKRCKNNPDAVYDNNWIALWGIPLVSAFMPYLFFGDELKQGVSFWHLYAHALAFTSLIWMVNMLAARKINRTFGEASQRKLRLCWLVIGAIVLTFLATFILRKLIPLIDAQYEEFCKPNELSLTLGTYLMVALILFMFETKRNARLYQNALTEKTELEKAQSIHVLESLKNQVNPHFLFNSLNTLVSLIREDNTKAEEFTRRLSSVYRAILDSQNEHLYPLEQELKLAEHYSWLLQARFGDHVKVVQGCAMQYAQNRFLPPLTLQLLLENAIKHNIASARQPLTIQISCTSGSISVSNNLQPKLQVTRGAGIGLENLTARYAYLTDQKLLIEQTETEFRVTLPLLKIQEIAA